MAIETNIWIYWLFCAIAMLLILTNRKLTVPLLSPNFNSPQKDKNYTIALTLGWITTLLAASGYILLTRKYETGAYEIPDLLCYFFGVDSCFLLDNCSSSP